MWWGGACDGRYLRDCVRGFHDAREDGDRTELLLNAVVPLVQRAEASELGPSFGASRGTVRGPARRPSLTRAILRGSRRM